MPTHNKTPVTAKNALISYYDIESLNNVFTLCVFTPRTNKTEIFYLVDDSDHPVSQELATTGMNIPDAWGTIITKNPAYTGGPGERPMRFWNLKDLVSNERLAEIFGLSDADSVNDVTSASTYPARFRPVCDTDPNYDPINEHAYLAGYNSFNYDTVIFAAYMMEAFAHYGGGEEGTQNTAPFTPVKASTMRAHSDELFTEEFKDYMPRYLSRGGIAAGQGWKSPANRIRQTMIDSGRQLDVARLNEVQQRVGLKRLLGMKGRQILESDKLGGHNAVIRTMAELIELLAYNVSDCIGLSQLFLDPTYAGAFDLKKALLDEYPETIYDKKYGQYAPDCRSTKVRRGRLTVDSSSAKFVGLILAPYSNLVDIETVSYMYPSEKVAAELGIPRVNVLEESRKFFYESIQDPQARSQFDVIYNYYKQIEGKNFNESEEYYKNYPTGPSVHSLGGIPRVPNNLPYFRSDGTPTSCFATFSTGGIHGAEADLMGLITDLREHSAIDTMLQRAKEAFPDPRDFVAEAKIQHNMLALPDGSSVNKAVVLLGSDPAKVSYRKPKKGDLEQNEQLERAQAHYPLPADLLARQRPAEHALYVYLPDGTELRGKQLLAKATAAAAAYREPTSAPELFPVQTSGKTAGSTKLNTKYTYTSADVAIHEDFTSYYPNMLRNMSAFYNEPLGEDRYAKILGDKDLYGKMAKAPGISAEEKNRLNILRNGTKLILNSASGAGDTTHHTPIRVNNSIISMRILGQLFSWRIGQAQTQAGARIISTNTDGLYSVLDEETNNRVLAEQQALIHVEIEPEPLMLVSKDSNNRLELEVPEPGENPWETRIISASGSSLACHKGPNPTKSLAHPAVLDHGLATYLRYIIGGYVPAHRSEPLSMSEPLDLTMGRQILQEVIDHDDPIHAAMLFQNVIAASIGSLRFPFATKAWAEGEDPDVVVEPRTIQHYNRVFIVRQGTPGAVGLRVAGATKVTAVMAAKRKRDNLKSVETDPVAVKLLREQGFARDYHDANANKLEMLPTTEDVGVRKLTGIEPTWSVLIINDDLHCLPVDQLRELLSNLDLDIYLQSLAQRFQDNWMNRRHNL